MTDKTAALIKAQNDLSTICKMIQQIKTDLVSAGMSRADSEDLGVCFVEIRKHAERGYDAAQALQMQIGA